MHPSTEEWLGDLGLSQHKAMLEAAGLTDAAGFGIAPQCLNDLLKEAGLPLPARAKILANAHPPDEDGIRMVSAVDATTTHYWPVGVAVGLVLVLVPCCVLYYFHRQHTSRLTPHASQRLAAVIGLVLFVVLQILITKANDFFSVDLMEERSRGVDFKEVQSTNLTNTGVVGALILTIVLAALQADPPVGDEPDALLNQFYAMNLVIGLYYSMNATAVSSFCLMYIMPLDGAAMESFLSKMASYVSEPLVSVLFSLLCSLNAMVLWVYGVYGEGSGLLAAVICAFVVIRATVVMLNLVEWKNPDVDGEMREARSKIISGSEYKEVYKEAREKPEKVAPAEY